MSESNVNLEISEVLKVKHSINSNQQSIAYAFLLPSFLLILAFVYFPILFSLILSLYKNPGLLAISEDPLGYYMSIGNIYNIGIGEFIGGLYNNGFLPIIHSLIILLFAVLLGIIIRAIRPSMSKGRAFLISLFISLPVITYLLIFVLNAIIVTGSAIQAPLGNYAVIFTSKLIIGDFLKILLNTFLWAIICTFFHVSLGMGLAVLLNREFKGRTFFRTTFILPWAIPSFITALVWKNFIFDPNRGLLGKPAADYINAGSTVRYTYLDILLGTILIVYLIWLGLSHSEMDSRTRIYHYIGIAIGSILVITVMLNNQLQTGLSFFGNDAIRIDNIKSKFFYGSDLYIFGFQTKSIFLAAILTNIWLGIPFMMMSFLATLQSIPNSLYEAAKLDGASSLSEFTSVTFPNLFSTLRTVALLGIIWTFNLFNVFYILSQNQTNLGRRENYDIFITYIYYLVRQGPKGTPELAAGAALSFVVFIILVGFSKVYEMIFKEETV